MNQHENPALAISGEGEELQLGATAGLKFNNFEEMASQPLKGVVKSQTQPATTLVNDETESKLYGKLSERAQESTQEGGLVFNNFEEMASQPLKAMMKQSPSEKNNSIDDIFTFKLPYSDTFSGLGTMPKALQWTSKHAATQFADSALRGVSQVMLVNNPITGLIILIAIAIDSYYSFIFALVGVCSSTATAMILGLDTTSIQAGLFGYNGILVGMAVQLFSFGTTTNPSWQFLIPTIIMSTLSTCVFVAVGNVTVRLLELVPFTFPFQLATWAWMLAAQSAFNRFPLQGPIPALVDLMKEEVGSSLTAQQGYTGLDFILGLFNGFSQVYLVENAVSGALILAGVWVSSPTTAWLMLYGSLIGVAFGMGMGIEAATIEAGLVSYNPVLTSVVMGLFFVLTWRLMTYALLASVATVIVGAAVGAMFTPIGMPALTFPFTITCWVFILVARGNVIKGVVPISLDMVTTPENHSMRYEVSRRVSKRLVEVLGKLGNLSSYLKMRTEEDVKRLEVIVIPILLCSYAATGQLEAIQRILPSWKKSDTNSMNLLSSGDYDKRTPLMLACAESQTHIAKFLIEKAEVDVHAKDRWGGNALEDAVRARSLNLVRLLAGKGVRLSRKSKHLQPGSALLQSVASGDLYLCMLLLEAKVLPEWPSPYTKSTALHLACSTPNRIKFVELLLHHNAKVDSVDFTGCSPLDYAQLRGDAEGREIVSLLSQFMPGSPQRPKVDPATFTDEGTGNGQGLAQALASAATQAAEGTSSGHASVAAPSATLLPSKSSTDVAFILPALLCSASGRNATSEVAYLIGSVDSPSPFERSESYVESVDESQENASTHGGVSGVSDGADLDSTVHSLTRTGVVGTRVSASGTSSRDHCTYVSVNAADYDGRTALAIACQGAAEQTSHLLLSKGANANAVDRWGVTPLWETITRQPTESSAGPDAATAGADGASMATVSTGYSGIVSLLLEYGAVLPSDSEGFNLVQLHLFELAAQNSYSAWAPLLLLEGFDFNLADPDRWTALHVAAVTGSAKSVGILLKAGASAAMADRWGRTPSYYSKTEAVRALFASAEEQQPIHGAGQVRAE